MPTKVELNLQQANYLKLLGIFREKFDLTLSYARQSLWQVLDADIPCDAAFGTVLELENALAESDGAIHEIIRQHVERTGIQLGPGNMRLDFNMDGTGTIVLEDVIAEDSLAEVALLTGNALLTHKDFPAYSALAKDIFLEKIDAAIAESTDASQVQELQDARNFIIKFQRSAVEALSPVATAETVSA